MTTSPGQFLKDGTPTFATDIVPNIVPKGAFYFPVSNFAGTKQLGFLLLPEFTLLAFSAALDPLRIANQLSQKPLYRWTLFSETGQPVLSSSGVEIGVCNPITEVPKALRVMICSGNRGVEAADNKTVGMLRRHARFGGKFGGICTGAATLARAGLLEGRAFTLHWENQPGFIERFPNLTPSPRRFEVDGNLWTCGGGAAATEMMISIIKQDYGRDFAIVISDMCLNGGDIEPRMVQRSSLARALSTRNSKLVQIVQTMHKQIEEPLSLAKLSAQNGLSRRQIERQCKQLLNETPATIYRNIRLDRGRTLFVETDMSVSDISVACGFNSVSVFSRHYKERFGASPSAHSRYLKDR